MAQLILAFASGAFLFNAIPHLVQGIGGRRHMTPMARSSGPVVNVVWGWVNLIIAGGLAYLSNPDAGTHTHWVAFGLDGFIVSVSLAMFWANPQASLPWHKD